jgi:dsRNA-specific ribonuclease
VWFVQEWEITQFWDKFHMLQSPQHKPSTLKRSEAIKSFSVAIIAALFRSFESIRIRDLSQKYQMKSFSQIFGGEK